MKIYKKYAEHSESQYQIVENIEDIIEWEKELRSDLNRKAFQMNKMVRGNLYGKWTKNCQNFDIIILKATIQKALKMAKQLL